MKKVLVLVSLVAAVTAFSQGIPGTVAFQNRNANTVPPIAGLISYGPSSLAGSRGDATAVNINGAGSLVVGSVNLGGQFAMAGLYGGPAGTAEANLVLLVPAVGFRSGAAAGYVNVGSSAARTFPAEGQPGFVLAGQNATVQVRAWDFGSAGVDSWQAAQALLAGGRSGYMGSSALLTIKTGGDGAPVNPPANLIDINGTALQPFSIAFVPEPSIIGLGILGAIGGLMVFRRRS